MDKSILCIALVIFLCCLAMLVSYVWIWIVSWVNTNFSLILNIYHVIEIVVLAYLFYPRFL